MALHPELTKLIASGPLAHLSTTNADGSPQVSVIWIGMDGSRLVSAHLGHHVKLRNIERDPRVVISFLGPRDRTATLNPYVVLHAHARVEPSDAAWDLLDRLAKVYQDPGTTFPAPRAPGWIVSYDVRRVGGVGPWAQG